MEHLILIKSVMKPRDYSTLRAILKEKQGEKITPSIFKMADISAIKNYLEQERISYEIYNKNQAENDREKEDLANAYRAAAKDKERWKIGQKVASAATFDFATREKKRK